MLLGSIRIVEGRVRLYDVDGSYQELTIEDAFMLYEWVALHRYRLIEEMRLAVKAERKKGNVG